MDVWPVKMLKNGKNTFVVYLKKCTWFQCPLPARIRASSIHVDFAVIIRLSTHHLMYMASMEVPQTSVIEQLRLLLEKGFWMCMLVFPWWLIWYVWDMYILMHTYTIYIYIILYYTYNIYLRLLKSFRMPFLAIYIYILRFQYVFFLWFADMCCFFFMDGNMTYGFCYTSTYIYIYSISKCFVLP